MSTSTRVACTLLSVWALCLATPGRATLIYPDARLDFSAPARDSEEVVAILAQVLEARHFREEHGTAVAPNGRFRAIYRAPPYARVVIYGVGLACIRVSIYTARPDTGSTVTDAEARELRAALVGHLRAVFGERVIRYKPVEEGERCVQPL